MIPHEIPSSAVSAIAPESSTDDLLRRLKVAHVVLSLDVGGLERIVVDLVRAGRALGQDPSVICLERPGTLAAQVEALGATVLCAKKPPGLRLDTVGRLRELLRRVKPDVVHTHQVGALFYAGPAARRERIPAVVHTEHTDNVAMQRSVAKRARVRLLWAIAGATADRYCCVSDDIAESVMAYHTVPRRKVRVIPNGIDTAAFASGSDVELLRSELGIPPGTFVIGTVGRLNEVKSQDLLIRGFSQLDATPSRPHLLIVGDGPERERLERLSASLKIADRVHFAGYQARPERYLHLMDVFALTSRREGMPLAILEAWAAGLPVVAPRVGGVPRVVEHSGTGLLFETGDEASLVSALASLLKDPVLAARLSKAGHHLVRSRFDLEVMARDYASQYAELLLFSSRQSA